MTCPFCNNKIGQRSFKNSYVICCGNCCYIFSLLGPGHLLAKRNDVCGMSKPDFSLNQMVICVDPRHKMFLEFGKTLLNDPLYVRVDFNGTKIWMNKNSMQGMPQEWI